METGHPKTRYFLRNLLMAKCLHPMLWECFLIEHFICSLLICLEKRIWWCLSIWLIAAMQPLLDGFFSNVFQLNVLLGFFVLHMSQV